MSFEVQQMSADEFAACQRALGERVVRHGSVWWVRTRQVFYRPILPYQAYSLKEPELPPRGFGGLQYVVADPNEGNTTMGFLMLDSTEDYCLEGVSHNRRRLIKNAAKKFVIRPLDDIDEFKDHGFAAYSSFYQRTRYEYKSERTRREHYANWVDTIMACPKAFRLGGYSQTGRLHAVSVSYWIAETLTYSTFFSETQALRNGIGELMFHALRETVCHLPGLREVFVRRYQGGNGMDSYYLMRGAKLVVKPAKVLLHPATKFILKWGFPARYAALAGEINHPPPTANGESREVPVQASAEPRDDRG